MIKNMTIGTFTTTFFLLVFSFTDIQNMYAGFSNVYSCDSVKTKLVNGNVIDGFGYAVIGAKVKIKGKKEKETLTDSDGNYTIKVNSENDILIFSYPGCITKEIKVGKKEEINVELKIDRGK